MASRLSEIADEKHEMEMTPMIDVTFLLLIFFMCTLKFKTLEGKLAAYLPKDVGVNQQDAEPIEKVDILVRVREEGQKLKPRPGQAPRPFQADDTGRYRWNTPDLVAEWPELAKYPVRRLEYKVGPFRTQDLDKIEGKLRDVYKERAPTMPIDEKGEPKEVPATIDARPGTVYEDVADLLDAAINAGFSELTFVGAYDEQYE